MLPVDEFDGLVCASYLGYLSAVAEQAVDSLAVLAKAAEARALSDCSPELTDRLVCIRPAVACRYKIGAQGVLNEACMVAF